MWRWQCLLALAAACLSVGAAPAQEAGSPGLQHPEEGLLFEGDILLRPGQLAMLRGKEGQRTSRNLVASPTQLWPDGVVFYAFSDEFDDTQRLGVETALSDLQQQTCVRFQPRTTEATYLLLRNSDGCASAVGYHPTGGAIDMFLGWPGCKRRGTIQHEFLHALGFWHEHTRPDRDKHVTVVWDNIRPGLELNFFVRPPMEVRYLQMPYDYDSVMHYRSRAFSKDGRSHTIVPKDPTALLRIGQRHRFSNGDLAKLNRLYDCPEPFYRGDDLAKPIPEPSGSGPYPAFAPAPAAAPAPAPSPLRPVNPEYIVEEKALLDGRILLLASERPESNIVLYKVFEPTHVLSSALPSQT